MFQTEFQAVLSEMSRICGVQEGPHVELSARETEALSSLQCSPSTPPTPAGSPLPAAGSLPPPTPRRSAKRKPKVKKVLANSPPSSPYLDTSPGPKRSRHNSGTSLDSAIGDVYTFPNLSSASEDMERVVPTRILIEPLIPGCPPQTMLTTPRPETPPSLRQQRKKYQNYSSYLASRENRSGNGMSGDTGLEAPRRQEVEHLCVDLVARYQQALALYPPVNPAACMADSMDPLLVATQLLADSLSRLRVFLFGLETIGLLTCHDRVLLYADNICCLAILKASVGLDLGGCPVAYPLPYGENLGETEALHLITAHDLYNQLRAIIGNIQSLGIREFPVMLLVMMVAFFQGGQEERGAGTLSQPEKISKIHQYYNEKLQVYLGLRFGPNNCWPVLHNIYQTISRVREFSCKLRDFLAEVTSVGLQTQYEAVCENLGLIAYLVQCEPSADL